MVDDCLIWNGRKSSLGYGVLRKDGKTKLAHRVLYEDFHGVTLSRAQHILHSCDNPLCVNINHLRIGDQRENNKDRDSRGRQARGSTNGRARISEVDAKYILESGLSAGELASKFDLTTNYINKILRGERWAHLQVSAEAERRRTQRKLVPAQERKLDDSSVTFIRTSGHSQKQLAKRFGVSTSTVREVLKGQSYKDVC